LYTDAVRNGLLHNGNALHARLSTGVLSTAVVCLVPRKKPLSRECAS
jgi:hypothetical protein